ncbi:hypothetical protein MIR68_011068 [Amoeboaphelidium protococcarum]|nr:hypothetical protein MIR68_011068 [Amoeboaphelidium protococcarum]
MVRFNHGYPFVSLMAKLSRAYINHVVLSCLFVLYQLYNAYVDFNQDIGSLKSNIEDVCSSLEDFSSDFMSIRHALAVETNAALVRSFQQTVNLTIRAMLAGVSLFQKILIYVLTSYKKLVVCLVKAIIDSGIFLLKKEAQNIQNFLQNSVNAVVNESNKVANTFTNGINGFFNAFGNENVLPSRQNPVPDVQIPTVVADALSSINVNSTWAVDQGLQFIETPFELIKDQIRKLNESIRIPTQLFNVPDPVEVKFCGIDLAWVDEGARVMNQILYALFGIIALIILVSVLSRMWWMNSQNQIYEEKVAEHMDLGWLTGDEYQLRVAVHNLKRPRFSYISKVIDDKLNLSAFYGIKLRWLIDYIAYGPGVLIFLVGVGGLILSSMQLSALNQIERDFIPRAKDTVTAFVAQQLDATNVALFGFNDLIVTSANTAINGTNDAINSKIFTPIQQLSDKVNGTVYSALDDTERFLTENLRLDVFGPLVGNFFDCIKTDVLKSFNTILDVIDELEVDIPLVSKDMLMINATRFTSPTHRATNKVIGEPIHDEQGNVVGYKGGLAFFLNKWRRLINRQYFVSQWTTVFGAMTFIQGLVGFTVMVLRQRR